LRAIYWQFIPVTSLKLAERESRRLDANFAAAQWLIGVWVLDGCLVSLLQDCKVLSAPNDQV
jgi:hypothetical protein